MRDPNDYIDEIVREEESSTQFEYKNSYWEEMAGILNANDARKRTRAFILWSSSSSMVLLLAIASWFFISVAPVYNTRSNHELASLTPQNISHFVGDYQFTHNELKKLNNKKSKSQNTQTQVSSKNVLANANEVHSASFKKETVTRDQDVALKNDQYVYKKMKVVEPLLLSNDVDHKLITKEFDLPVTKQDLDRHTMNIYGGVSLGGFSNDGLTGLDYFAGVGYDYRLTKNWSIGTAIQYTRKSMNFTKKETYSRYSFGRTDEVVALNYDQLHSLQIPLKASFNHKKHTVTASVAPTYTFAVTTSFQHQRFNHEMDQFEVIDEVSNNYGIDEGIQPFDLQVGLGYSYAINSFMDIGGQFNVGTFDVTQNEYWQSEANHYNIDGRVFLKFNLF